MSELSLNSFNEETVNGVTGFTNELSKTSTGLREKSEDISGNLKDIAKSEHKVNADGVLSEDEQDNQSPYTDQEMQAFDQETQSLYLKDKKRFLTELQNIAKEQGEDFLKKLEIQKNEKEGKDLELSLAYSQIEEEIKAKIEDFKVKKEEIENKREGKITTAETSHQKSETRLRKKISKKRHGLANEIRNNPVVSEYSDNAKKLREAESYFGLQRTKEVQQGFKTKKEEVKTDSDFTELKNQIAELSGKLEDGLRLRREKLIDKLGMIEQEAKQELSQTKNSTLSEINELQQRLSQIDQEKEQNWLEIIDLEEQIEDKERMQESINVLKDELREFNFKDAKKVIADLEERSANTISLENLADSKEFNKDQLRVIVEKTQTMLDSLLRVNKAAEDDNENTYLEQEVILNDEKTRLLDEKKETHEDLVNKLKEPLIRMVKEARTMSDEELEEGENVFKMISNVAALGKENEEAVKKISKSTEALNKFFAKVKKRFAELTSKLDKLKAKADDEIFDSINTRYTDIAEVQAMAQEFKDTDFDQMLEAGGLLKRVFSKLFKK